MIFLKKLLDYLILLCIISQLACVFEYSDPVAHSVTAGNMPFLQRYAILCRQQYLKQDTTDRNIVFLLLFSPRAPWSILGYLAFHKVSFQTSGRKTSKSKFKCLFYSTSSIFVCKSQYMFLKAVFSKLVFFSHELRQKSLVT